MHVICKIFSANFILHLKLKGVISKTPFFQLSDLSDDMNPDQIIFWDVDSKDIDRKYIANCIENGSLIMIISSLYNDDFILKNFDKNEKMRFGILQRNFSYNDFIQEISRIADVNRLNPQ